MARKFLYLIAVLIVVVIAAMAALRLWPLALSRAALVPNAEFISQPDLQSAVYGQRAMWLARPDMDGTVANPALWLPRNETRLAPKSADGDKRPAVFFIHPTSHWDKRQWNARLDDTVATQTAALFLRGMASPFAASGDVWAPRYRQATFGAFLSDKPEAQLALDAAYHDISQAFDAFLAQTGDRPIILAGHSQGSVHLLRLLQDRVADTRLASRIIAAYPIGWPVSLEHDLPQLGLPACNQAGQAACIVSWVSFAEPADPATLLDRYRATAGLDGKPRGDGPILCTNPLTGNQGGDAPANGNLGTLRPDASLADGELIAQAVPARCSDNGILLIGDPPQLGQGVLPGNNYHIYDIPLFWKNLQQDVIKRTETWQTGR